MLRQIVGYIPSTVVPAIASFAMIYIYTRLLTPAEFGGFSLVFSVILVVQASLFFAVPLALMRFYKQAVEQQRKVQFLGECYTLFYLLSGSIVILIGAPIALFTNAGSIALWTLAVLVLLARSAVILNQSVNRVSFQIRRYNIIECLHAGLGLGLGSLFIYLLASTAEAVMLGLLVASTVCALADCKLLLLPFQQGRQTVDTRAIGRLIRFSLPLVVMDTTVCLLALSDRFLLSTLAGAEALGVYTVAYNLVERPTALICTAMTAATFPIAVQVVEDHGPDAGGRQAGRNASFLLAVLIPGCVGLGFVAPYMAAVMIGDHFRLGVAALIPIMSATALFRGISTHAVDHAFHLAGRPALGVLIYAPAAAINIILNLIFIPKYGVVAAAWAGLGCQAAAVVAGCSLGRCAFPISWPVRDIFKIAIAVVPLALTLNLVKFSLSWSGLLYAVSSGAVVFSASAVLLDVAGMRSLTLKLALRVPAVIHVALQRCVVRLADLR